MKKKMRMGSIYHIFDDNKNIMYVGKHIGDATKRLRNSIILK